MAWKIAMTREPETLIDQMVQALIEGRPVVTPLGREIILRCTRRPEAFGYQSPEEEYVAFMAADSSPIGFGEIELPCDSEWKDGE